MKYTGKSLTLAAAASLCACCTPHVVTTASLLGLGTLGGCRLATVDDTLGAIERAAGAAEAKAREIRTQNPDASLSWQSIIALVAAAGGALLGGTSLSKASMAKAKADTAQSHVDDLYDATHASVARPQTVQVEVAKPS